MLKAASFSGFVYLRSTSGFFSIRRGGICASCTFFVLYGKVLLEEATLRVVTVFLRGLGCEVLVYDGGCVVSARRDGLLLSPVSIFGSIRLYARFLLGEHLGANISSYAYALFSFKCFPGNDYGWGCKNGCLSEGLAIGDAP